MNAGIRIAGVVGQGLSEAEESGKEEVLLKSSFYCKHESVI